MKSSDAPTGTYRLQFNRHFTFADASKIIPYLHALGVSHVYASPFFMSHQGSTHGYDIVDHNLLNPEIGDQKSFEEYIAHLHQHGMGQIIDIVPNHMAVGGDENSWWMDVLENGPASAYAEYFDIDWHPVNPVLHNKVLLPFLGNHYGSVLEAGELNLILDTDKGLFSVVYREIRFPIDPRSYPQILTFRLDELAQQIEPDSDAFVALKNLISMCQSLPRRTELSAPHRLQRQQLSLQCKEQLAEICRRHASIRSFLQQNIQQFNTHAGKAKDYDHLHRLLEAQAYRLAYWQVASEDINYRRFFDINQLAGIRVENKQVFDATHGLIRQLIKKGQANGLRIDHADGLSDPYKYCCDLQHLMKEAQTDGQPDGYLLVEKILASHERLPDDWPVAGTTGYDAAFLLNGLFIHPDGEQALQQLYRRFTGRHTGFDELLYECKNLIIRSSLSSELTVLANLVSSVARCDPHTRDFTYHGLRAALGEVVACFPVYRTYVSKGRITAEDRQYVKWAVSVAKKRSRATDIAIFDFLHDALLLNHLDECNIHLRRKLFRFVLRFQQYTAPVMAKGMEDTAFYIHNPLISLNDVGFDPRRFCISTNAFHHENKQRHDNWPQAMVTTSTHDSKRSEDVRARINVLSELPDEWRRHLRRWCRINRSKKTQINNHSAPSYNDEYFFYQSLLGSWPLQVPDAAALDNYAQRVEASMLKAIKEAKQHTSWINADPEYEQAMRHFVRTLLSDLDDNAFLADFIPFQRRISRYGLYNSLSQSLLKLTIPGIPDTYQGNELWAFNLVDPDNRRPVDYEHRLHSLQSLIKLCEQQDDQGLVLQDLLHHCDDGRVKLYVHWKIMNLRRRHPELFHHSGYHPLSVTGDKAECLCAFSRQWKEQDMVVVAARWFVQLSRNDKQLPIGQTVWQNTFIQAPEDAPQKRYKDILSNHRISCTQKGEQTYFHATDLLRHFPMALLISE